MYYLFIYVDPAHSHSLLFNWHKILVGSLCATFHKNIQVYFAETCSLFINRGEYEPISITSLSWLLKTCLHNLRLIG